ncbi:unnamed protein product [Cylindrotheca closterium]|uniref:EGF-like domain-containing protein n=1 Tax=Cylindrotheca closterium TaxID=2856 RepID=A0AAD2GBX5_9STRA|nr:unnamed protein product [Cylindrotheca closterium]
MDAFQGTIHGKNSIIPDAEDGLADGNARQAPLRRISSENWSKHPLLSSVNTKMTYTLLLDKIERLELESDSKTKELEKRLQETENKLGISPLASLIPWRSSSITRDGPVDSTLITNNNTKRSTFKLTPDMYSILACWEWSTKPFWASLFVVFLQITLLSVLIVDLIGGATVDNILNLPGNVEYTVRIAQAVAVPIAVFKQEDLREGIEGIFLGMPHAFRGDIKFQSMKPIKWRIGYFLRFAQGFLSMFASFILLIQAETVFDLLLNFLGIEFISDLDNLAFRLAGIGYFGITTRDCVNTISEAEFSKDEKDTGVVGVAFSPSWFKKYAHILGVFFIFIAMVSSFIFYAAQQYDGEYLTSTVRVEFGDETLPFLGIFNGCYTARSDGTIAERLVYEQMGRSTMQGKLAYCSGLDDGSWVFFHEGDDPCNNPIASSGSTKTFDVLETAESQWYTNTGLPLEYLQIYKIDETDTCGSRDLLDATRDTCLTIEFELEGQSSTFQKHQLSASDGGEALDAMRSHPIYVSANGSNPEVVIFTGRRWVLANSSNLGSWENTTALLDATGNEEFYSDLLEANDEWILSVSEPVDRVNDQGTPLGLQWYFPRDINDESNTTIDFNFRISDLTRPVDLACTSCNSKTNPCLYEGLCRDTTGECECKHGASGKLCREKPLGDGICNTYFNTPENEYDGGDCCADTCEGVDCDDSSIDFPFGIDMSKRGNASRAAWFEIVFGFDTPQNTFGYDECRDPDQASFTIEMKPSVWRFFDPEAPLITSLLGLDADFDWFNSFYCIVEKVLLTCDDKPYMELPAILDASTDYDDGCPTYRQSFQVPYGASCEVTYSNYMQFLRSEDINLLVKVVHSFDENPLYEGLSQLGDTSIPTFPWDVPLSKCITEAFSNRTKSIFDKTTIEGAVANSLSNSGRAIEWCENKGDRGILFERFGLEALLMLLLGSTETIGGEVNHCSLQKLDEGFFTRCNDDRVLSLEIDGDYYTTNVMLADLLGLMQSFPQLQYLGINGTVLNGPIPVMEIANLHNLTTLGLVNGRLNGTIPTEISSLQKLETVILDNNELTGPAIPSELLSLERLSTYAVSNNRLGGSIPVEIENLKASLQTLHLNGNEITGTLPTVLGTLEEVVSLKLEGNQLTGTIPSTLGNLRFALELTIFDNRLTGSIPNSLQNLRFLSTLKLDGNELGGTIPGLGMLELLKIVHLDSNLLTGTIPSEFGNLSLLSELTLFSNRLSSSIPSTLANLTLLEVCNILGGNSNMTGGTVGVCT